MPYQPDFIVDLDRTITNGRLSRYLTAAGGNVEQALQLYEKNIALSEALFGVLHVLEIALRNSIHYVLSRDIGTADWYRDNLPLPALFPAARTLSFTGPMNAQIMDARSYAGGAGAPIGKVIAELTFGFWPSMLTKRFEPLWDPSLHKAFPAVNKSRGVAHWRFRTIQHLRNRIAHHEPILTSGNRVQTGFIDQKTMPLSEILEAARWISPPTADWLQSTTRYSTAVALLDEIAKSGMTL